MNGVKGGKVQAEMVGRKASQANNFGVELRQFSHRRSKSEAASGTSRRSRASSSVLGTDQHRDQHAAANLHPGRPPSTNAAACTLYSQLQALRIDTSPHWNGRLGTAMRVWGRGAIAEIRLVQHPRPAQLKGDSIADLSQPRSLMLLTS